MMKLDSFDFLPPVTAFIRGHESYIVGFKQRYLIVAQEVKYLLVQNLINGAAKMGFKTKIKMFGLSRKSFYVAQLSETLW